VTVVSGRRTVLPDGVLAVASVSVSTRRQSDVRGLVTAGRAVRLQLTAGLDVERALW
jgi:hypothetical protein